MKYGLFLLDDKPNLTVQPDRKQHQQCTTPTATWQQYAWRSLGTPFPASTPVSARAVDDQGDWYRELVQKAQRELEETRLFLSKLSVDKPAPLVKSDVDKNVADTLAKVEQMRHDFENQREQKQKANEAEKAEAAKKDQDAKQAEEIKKAEATKKAAEEAKQAKEAKQAIE
ncbi:hypothetical protein IW148_000081 [Coemansia sp. RSA 1199]|nr:hypothetical protein IW148_000081 [Coemansia sp. RSA 1199]